jgi:hypothetical protein
MNLGSLLWFSCIYHSAQKSFGEPDMPDQAGLVSIAFFPGLYAIPRVEA